MPSLTLYTDVLYSSQATPGDRAGSGESKLGNIKLTVHLYVINNRGTLLYMQCLSLAMQPFATVFLKITVLQPTS